MADRPILFSAPMIRALLSGTKTQTRRVVKPQPNVYGLVPLGDTFIDAGEWQIRQSGIIKIGIGARLWVREAWRTLQKWDDLKPSHLADDASKITFEADAENRNKLWAFGKLRPSMFMPRWASRLTLTVTDVRVERLQEISETDAISEGIDAYDGMDADCSGYLNYANNSDDGYWLPPRASYASLWNHINGAGAWEANPWVVCYSFEVIKQNIDRIEQVAA